MMEVYLDKKLCFFEEIKMVPCLQCIHLYMQKKNIKLIKNFIRKKNKNNPSDVAKFLQIKFNNIHIYTNIIMD